MSRCLYAILILIVASCGKKNDTRTPEEKRKAQCNLTADFVTNSFAEKMYQEKGFVMIGMGGGGIGEEHHRKIRMLSVTFQCYQSVDMQQARELLLECIQKFLDQINKKKELEECVHQFPFTDKNLSITILFLDKNKLRSKESRFVSPPSLASVDADEGILKYWSYSDTLHLDHKETYEEALQIALKN